MRKVFFYVISFCISLFLIATYGCTKPGEPSNKIIARINNDPIYASDLKRELALKATSDPLFKITPYTLENEIDNIINKRLLIQEARRLKLDQTKRFVNTIKTFWEQTLIRDLIAVKDKEIEEKVSVTDEEIKDYYNKLSQKVTFKLIKRKDKDVLKKMLGVEKELIAWEEVIGPVGYEDIDSGVLRMAFDLNVGDANIFSDKNMHYLVYLATKQPSATPPLKEIYLTIKRQIKEKKQNEKTRNWLQEMRDDAKIEIDKKFLSTSTLEE